VGVVSLIVVLTSAACLAAGAGIGALIMKARQQHQSRQEKRREIESEQIRALMSALVPTGQGQVWCLGWRGFKGQATHQLVIHSAVSCWRRAAILFGA
jgi:uncharacterized protein YneF (UPF0154 family)